MNPIQTDNKQFICNYVKHTFKVVDYHPQLYYTPSHLILINYNMRPNNANTKHNVIHDYILYTIIHISIISLINRYLFLKSTP